MRGDPVEVLGQCRDYLLAERRLAAATAVLNVPLVRPFLATACGLMAGLDLPGLRAGEVARSWWPSRGSGRCRPSGS